jgi:hypothetical protein
MVVYYLATANHPKKQIILVTLVISVVIIVEIEKSPTNLLKRLLLF